MNLLAQYSYLQVLDLLTTLAFIANGVSEANPLIAFAMNRMQSPLLALSVVKLGALGLGFYCWRKGRLTLLSKANVGFACLIAWNLLALIAASRS